MSNPSIYADHQDEICRHLVRVVARCIKFFQNNRCIPSDVDCYRELGIGVLDSELYLIMHFIAQKVLGTPTTAFDTLDQIRRTVLGPIKYERLHRDFAEILALPEVRDYIRVWGLEEIDYLVEAMPYLGL